MPISLMQKLRLVKQYGRNIELHINSSDWAIHHHLGYPNYNNVILNIESNHNATVKDKGGNSLRTLELKSRIPKLLLERYKMLMESSQFIPCEAQLQQVNELTIANWKQKLVAERFIKKSAKILAISKRN